MLSRLRDVVTRHRRKFFVTGVLIGGTLLMFKYAQRKLIEIQERQTREFIEKARRMQHFESTERTCNQVIIGMSLELCTAIMRECSTEELLSQLRQQPENKVELWEEMKIIAFTRLAIYIYATSMLVVTLRVQMNLLGGYLYKDIMTEQQHISDQIKHNYLALIRHFMHDGGLKKLAELIRVKVSNIFQQLPLTKRLTLPDLEQLFYSLQMGINGDIKDPNSKMAEFLLPSELNEYSSTMPLVKKMYSDTLDLLESDDVSVVCSQNVNRGFSLAIDAIAESMTETLRVTQNRNSINGNHKQESQPVDAVDLSTPPSSSATRVYNYEALNINSVEVPLAKLIPIVSGLTSKGFDNTTRPQNFPTSLVTFYMISEKTKILGANVYETFSC